jgi:hypothetical protein
MKQQSFLIIGAAIVLAGTFGVNYYQQSQQIAGQLVPPGMVGMQRSMPDVQTMPQPSVMQTTTSPGASVVNADGSMTITIEGTTVTLTAEEVAASQSQGNDDAYDDDDAEDYESSEEFVQVPECKVLKKKVPDAVTGHGKPVKITYATPPKTRANPNPRPVATSTPQVFCFKNVAESIAAEIAVKDAEKKCDAHLDDRDMKCPAGCITNVRNSKPGVPGSPSGTFVEDKTKTVANSTEVSVPPGMQCGTATVAYIATADVTGECTVLRECVNKPF